MTGDLKPGDRVFRWVWTGGNDADINLLTVVRVNRVTVTVDTEGGNRIRINPADVAGRVDWEEEAGDG